MFISSLNAHFFLHAHQNNNNFCILRISLVYLVYYPQLSIGVCLQRNVKYRSYKSLCESASCKGQLISKCLFGVLNFLQKTNENKSNWGFIVKSVHFKKTVAQISFLSKLWYFQYKSKQKSTTILKETRFAQLSS